MSNLGNKEIMAENIQYFMNRLGVDRNKLSSDLKISYTTVSDWINAKTYPRIDKIELLANYFNVNKAELVESRQKLDNVVPFHKKEDEYPIYNTGVPAGGLADIGTFVESEYNDLETISLPDSIMGRYAGSQDIFITYIAGESMNNVIPDESLIAVKRIESAFNLENGDIVVFRNGSGMSVKRFYNDKIERRLVFRPDSSDKTFIDMVVSYEDAEDLQIYGKVVVYVVKL